jgi:hypothetical protein
MEPEPLFASPPETDHVTDAGPPPPVSVAENCSTEVPWALVELQPVQLVSMALVPGAMEKVALEGLAATFPPAQPTAKMRTGARRIETVRSGKSRGKGKRERPLRLVEGRMGLRGSTCTCLGNGLCTFLDASANVHRFDGLPGTEGSDLARVRWPAPVRSYSIEYLIAPLLKEICRGTAIPDAERYVMRLLF